MQGGSLTYKPSWFLETFFSLHKLYVKKAKKINKHHFYKGYHYYDDGTELDVLSMDPKKLIKYTFIRLVPDFSTFI